MCIFFVVEEVRLRQTGTCNLFFLFPFSFFFGSFRGCNLLLNHWHLAIQTENKKEKKNYQYELQFWRAPLPVYISGLDEASSPIIDLFIELAYKGLHYISDCILLKTRGENRNLSGAQNYQQLRAPQSFCKAFATERLLALNQIQIGMRTIMVCQKLTEVSKYYAIVALVWLRN